MLRRQIWTLALAILAAVVMVSPTVAQEPAPGDDVVPAPACFKQVAGQACDNYTDASPECPDNMVSSDTCNQVAFNAIGFMSSTSYSAICRMEIRVENEEGECYTVETRDITMRCKDAEGAACKVQSTGGN